MIEKIVIVIILTFLWASARGQTSKNSVHYDSIEPVHYDLENRFIVEKDGKFGLVDSNLVILTPIEFDFISNWETKKLLGHIVMKDGKQGLLSQSGSLTIPTEYDELIIGLNNYIIVKKEGFYGTITKQNERVLPIIYEEILWNSSAYDYRIDKIDRLYVKLQGNYAKIDFEGNIMTENISKELVDNFRAKFELEKIWLDPLLKKIKIYDVEINEAEILN